MLDAVERNTSVFVGRSLSKHRKNRVYILLLFLLSPLLSLLVAFKNNQATWSKNVLWLFVAFHGLTMVIPNEGIDASRYKDQLIEFAEANLTPIEFLMLLYNEDSNYVDIVQPLITYFLSNFTTDYKILFFAFGLIFGFFYSRNLWYLLHKEEKKFSVAQVLILVTFSLTVPFWFINGFRMWAASVIFFYGAIQFLYDNRKKGVIIAALSIFVHFSFILPMLVLLGYILVRTKVHMLFWLFLASFLIAEVNLEFIREFVNSYFPSFLQAKVKGYTNEEYSQNIKENIQQTSLHAVYFGLALKWAITTLLVLIYFKGRRLVVYHKNLLSVFCFTLLFISIANITSLVPSGGRFITVAHLFALAFIFFYTLYVPKEHFINKTILLVSPALLFFCIVAIRLGFDTIGLSLLGNPILAIFLDVKFALIDFIK